MDKFIGRQKELVLLGKAFGSRESEFVPIYGRRRIGKSELILKFLKGKRGIYFLGKKAQATLQIQEFLQEAAAVLEEPFLAGLQAQDWKTALQAVTDLWKGKTKLILAFDEFQWTAGASPELPSIIQEFWDRRWKKNRNVLLILCGSYVGFMERAVLGQESPLFGRRTAQIQLRPFNFKEAAEFHPNFSWEERARTYFICGGIPLYLQCFSNRLSVEMNIAGNFLDEFAALFREPDFLLREELREIENYYAILLAAATGFTTHQAISDKAGIDERAMNYYLKQLEELGYLARRYPLTGQKPAVRTVRYVLEDPLLKFWFRFVYPNTSFILQMGAERALKDRIRPRLEAFFGECFEKLCRESLPFLYSNEGITSAFEVGEYWDKTLQIDVVGLRDDGWIDLGECKWGKIRSAKELEKSIDEKAAGYPNPKNATIQRRLFTRIATEQNRRQRQDLRWHSLEELYCI